MGLVESATEFYPDAQWQRCVVHWMPSCPVPTGKMREVALMLKAIHAQESREAARAKATLAKLRAMRLTKGRRLARGDGRGDLSLPCLPP